MRTRTSRNKWLTGGPVLVVAGALALAACGSSGGDSSSSGGGTKDVKVAYVGSRTISYQNAIYDGLSSVKGIDPTFVEGGFDVNAQAKAIEDVIASKQYKALVFLPNSATGLGKAVKHAIAEGMQVINVEATLGPDPASGKVQYKGQTASIVEDYHDLGGLQTKLALEACKEAGKSPCNMARVMGLPQFATEQLEVTASKEIVSKAGPDATLKTVFAGGYDSSLALKATEDLLTSNSDIDVILTGDTFAKGVQQAITRSHRKIMIAALGGTKDGMKAVADGRYYGEIALFPTYAGQLAGETILKHTKNPDLKAESLNPVPPGHDVTYTKANVSGFAGQYN